MSDTRDNDQIVYDALIRYIENLEKKLLPVDSEEYQHKCNILSAYEIYKASIQN